MDAISNHNLSILMLPWLAHGHISPFLELAKTLSNRNFHIFFCSTSVNLNSIKPKLPSSSSSSIQLVELHLPSSNELPPHLHTTKGLPSHLMSSLKEASHMSAQNFHSILQKHKPDLVIYDCAQPWAPKVASSLEIPSITFNIFGVLVMAASVHAILTRGQSESPFPEFVLDNHWHKKYITSDGGSSQEARRAAEDIMTSLYSSKSVVLINSFREIEGKYIDFLSNILKKKVIPIGPLVHEPNEEEEEEDDEDDYSSIRKWLDKKEPFSTVFVSFGSEYFPTKEEMEEIAHGLEESEANFIWVIRFPQGDNYETSIEEILGEGFMKRVGERGMIVKEWAPQARILKHKNIGGFVSHCGWNSVMESMMFGVPIIAIPMQLDQPYNARLVEEVGVGLEAKRDSEGKIQREEVAKLIREVVVEKTSQDMRKKMREIGKVLKIKGDEKIDEFVAEISGLV